VEKFYHFVPNYFHSEGTGSHSFYYRVKKWRAAVDIPLAVSAVLCFVPA